MLTVSQMIRGALNMAKAITVEDIAYAYIGNMELTGKAADHAMARFEGLGSILEENRESGRARAFFVPEIYGFFGLMGRKLPLFCTIEGILAAALMAMKGMNEPFSTGNSTLIFSLKSGRRLCLWKRGAALLAGWLWGVILWGLTLLLTGLLFPLGSLWQAPAGSMMMLSGMYPLLPAIPMTLLGYMLIQCVLSLAVMGLFSLFFGWAALYTKNILTAAAGLGLLCMAIYTFAELFPGTGMLWFAVRYNPVTLAMDAGRWLVCYRQEAEIAKTISVQYGPRITPENYEQMKRGVPFEGKERLDDLIRDIPEFSQAGITSMETLVLNETLDEDQEEALWAAINDAISLRLYEDPTLGSQLITDALELSYWSDYIETYKDEVLDPPEDGTMYYSDLTQVQARRVAQRNQQERNAVLPRQMVDTHFEVLQFLGPMMIIGTILLIMPYMVRENYSKMPALLYTFLKGRRYFRIRLWAVMISCLLLTAVYVALFAVIAWVNRIGDFWNTPVSTYTSGFISWFPWTLGQLTVAAVGLCAAAAFGAGLMAFVLTARCQSYITAIAVQLPMVIAGVLFGAFCIMDMTEITKSPWLPFILGVGWLALGLLGSIVICGLEKRRNVL